ncbi:MAG: VTT domain-containing protein [Candidatus Hydrothermales bacterium]
MLKKIFTFFIVILFIIFVVSLLILLYPYNKARVIEIVNRVGVWGPLLLVFFHSFQVIVAPLPGHVFPFLIGFFYGFIPGIFLAILGNFLGSSLGFLLGRMGGKKFLKLKKFEKLEKYKEKIKSKSFLWLSILFLLPLPGIPKDLLCYFAGFIGVRIKDFILALLLGRLPAEIFWVLTGAGVYSFLTPPS